LSDGINGFLETTRQALEKTSAVLSRLSNGDLTHEIEGNYRGIFADRQKDTNATIEQLRNVIGQIKEAARTIDESVRDIASGNMDLSERTETQARNPVCGITGKTRPTSGIQCFLNPRSRTTGNRSKNSPSQSLMSAAGISISSYAESSICGRIANLDQTP
jgi:hypothetical protein